LKKVHKLTHTLKTGNKNTSQESKYFHRVMVAAKTAVIIVVENLMVSQI
jgi:hypothetical protein